MNLIKPITCSLAILFSLVLPGTPSAGFVEDMAKCSAIKGQQQQQACYQNAGKPKRKAPELFKPRQVIGTGKWQTEKSKSPLDDSTNVYLSVDADQPITSGYNTVVPSMMLRCSEGKTSVFINWGLYLGIDETEVLVRFGDEEAKSETWSISTDFKAIFAPGNNIFYVQKMTAYDKMLVKVTPYSESPVMATFDISGLSNAINPLREACRW